VRNILFEVTPTNKATGTTVTVRLSAIEANAFGTQLDGFEWVPAMIDWPERSISLTSNGELSPISVSHGSLSFVITDNRALADYVWTGAYGRCFVGNMGDPFASYKPIFEGRCGPIAVDGGLATVTLLGLEADLEQPLLNASYVGTGGAEGGSGLKGKLKPWASGNCLNIEPVLIDPAKLIYQYHGYGPTQAVDNVFEAALSLGAPAQTAASYSALASLTLAKGTWAAAPAVGMFRLANQPKGTITADVRGALDGASYPATLATIAPHLIKQAGVLPSAIDSTSFAAHSEEWCYFTTAQSSVGDVVRDALSQVGGYLIPSSTGAFRAGDFFGASTTKPLSADGSSELHLLSSTIKEAPSPVYRVTIGNRPSWRVMSGSEVSPALSSVSDDAYAVAQAAQDAADAAAEAQADATAANIRIASISADGVLDRAEKPQILREYAAIGADVTEHGARADALGVDKSAMVASFNALTAYLSGLSPAWDNTAVDTPIDRIAFNGRFFDARQAIAALAAANAAKAATLSTWNGVTGPGKPADNATVGAPGDTPVGSSTGNQVVARIEAAHATIAELESLIGNIPADSTVAQEINRVAAAEIGGNLLPSSDFANGTAGWGLVTQTPQEFNFATNNAEFTVTGEHYMGLLCKQPNGDIGGSVVSDWVAVTPGAWVQISAWLASRECTALLRLQWGDGSGGYLSDAADSSTVDGPRGWENLDGWARVWTKAQAPTDARFARLALIKGPYLSNPANDLSWAMMLRPMLALATADQTVPSNYRASGGGAGLARASARIEEVSTAAAGQTAAIASRTTSLEASYNGLTGRVSTTEGAISNINGKVGAYWSTTTVSPNNRAQLRVFAEANGGAGVDIVGDLTVSGDVLVGGTVRTAKLDSNAAQSVQFARTSNQQLLSYGQSTRIVQLTFQKYVQESSIDLYANIRMKSGDDIVGSFRVTNLNNGNIEDTFPITMIGANDNFQVPIALNWIATGWTPGIYTIAIDYLSLENDAQTYAEAGSILKIHEIKR
jgi:hypothetical protein